MSARFDVHHIIKAFFATDFAEDFKLYDMPKPIIDGDDDQIVLIGAASRKQDGRPPSYLALP